MAKDAAGNVIDDVKPTYAVQAGTWGAPKEAQKVRCRTPLSSVSAPVRDREWCRPLSREAVASDVTALHARVAGDRGRHLRQEAGLGAGPPPPSRTNWTRLVHPSVLTGHVSSLSPVGQGRDRP